MDKAARFRAKQKAAGFIQANEWVPSNHRQLFREVAKALREGVPVTIGRVTSDQQAKPKTNDRVTSDRKKKAAARKAALHAENDALFNAKDATHIEVMTPKGQPRDGVIVDTSPIAFRGMTGNEQTGVQTVVLAKTGNSYRKLIFFRWGSEWTKDRNGWTLAEETRARQKADVDGLRRKLKEYHPDTGANPDTHKFMETHERLTDAQALDGRLG